jgi:hypothetical protein
LWMPPGADSVCSRLADRTSQRPAHSRRRTGRRCLHYPWRRCDGGSGSRRPRCTWSSGARGGRLRDAEAADRLGLTGEVPADAVADEPMIHTPACKVCGHRVFDAKNHDVPASTAAKMFPIMCGGRTVSFPRLTGARLGLPRPDAGRARCRR